MKYKVNDRVRIKSIDWYNENKSKSHGTVACGGKYFDYDMREWCGKIMTILTAYQTCYIMQEDGAKYSWTDEMIEGLVEEELNKEIERFQNLYDDIMETQRIKSVELITEKVFICPEGYEFRDENDNVINAQKIVLEKKKPKYPQTYEECLKALGYDDRETYCVLHTAAHERLFERLYQLLICRDAYWKIAGYEMGLGKPWGPDWEDDHQYKYTIYTMGNKVIRHVGGYIHSILAFPTPEMRDAFYENFKELIESVKELL